MALACGFGDQSHFTHVFARLTGIISEPGYATTVLLIAGFGALNALGLSVVGAYAWRAFENTKQRPLAIVQRRYTFEGEPRP